MEAFPSSSTEEPHSGLRKEVSMTKEKAGRNVRVNEGAQDKKE